MYDLKGATLTSIRPADRTVSDVAVDDRAGLVFVSGFRQVNAGRCVPVQIAYVHAYDQRGSCAGGRTTTRLTGSAISARTAAPTGSRWAVTAVFTWPGRPQAGTPSSTGPPPTRPDRHRTW
ncbi:hypothetical protein NKG94_50420 [Micromonospora sp. M12]